MSDERLELEKVITPEEAPLVRPGYPRLGAYPDGSQYGYGYGYPDGDERAYVLRMWRAIKKRKLMIIVIAMIVTSVVTVEVYRTKSTYQAATTVEIGRDNRTLRSGNLIFQTEESDDMFYVQSAMKTRIRQLQSRPLLEDVVVNLKLDQNSHFMDVNTRKSILESVKTIAGRFTRQEKWVPPPVQETTTAASSGERSREESAHLAPYVDVLAANMGAEPLADTRMLVISFTH